MISRRIVFKLGAVGLIAPSIGLTIPTHSVRAIDPQPDGIGPSLEYPIIVKWRFDILAGHSGDYEYRSVTENTVYLSLGGNLWAIDAATGTERWVFSTLESEYNTILHPREIDGTVFGCTEDGNLYAIDAETGILRWQNQSFAFWPIVIGKKIFAGSQTGTLKCIDVETGETQWETDPGGTVGSDILFNLPIGTIDDAVVIINETGMFAYDVATGTEKWRFSINLQSISGPILYDESLYFASNDGFLHAINGSTGEERWRTRLQFSIHPQTIVQNTLLVFADSGSLLSAFDTETGEELWQLNHASSWWEHSMGDDWINPTVAAGSLFYPYDHEDPSGQIFAVDIANGTVKWKFDKASYPAAPALGGHSLYVNSANDGAMYSLDTLSGEVQWRFDVDVIWGTSPIVEKGVVYLSRESESDDKPRSIYAIANLLPSILTRDVIMRAAPSNAAVDRGGFESGTEIKRVGAREDQDGETWIEVTIDEINGWIPVEAIDPATLPPEGEIEWVYVPE